MGENSRSIGVRDLISAASRRNPLRAKSYGSLLAVSATACRLLPHPNCQNRFSSYEERRPGLDGVLILNV